MTDADEADPGAEPRAEDSTPPRRRSSILPVNLDPPVGVGVFPASALSRRAPRSPSSAEFLLEHRHLVALLLDGALGVRGGAEGAFARLS